MNTNDIPIWQKYTLSIEEASRYFRIGEKKLRRAADFARRHGLRLHIHVSETETEVRDCLREHGMTPVRYLDSIGFLGPDVIAAHCVHVDRQEWEILSRRRVTVSHCPCSNMKLGSGRFPYELAIESGCRITLGTDGASSDNCLDMLQEMKFAAVLHNGVGRDPMALTAWDALVGDGADSEGMALAFQLLCSDMGLDSEIVEGTLEGTPHFFNSVTRNGTTVWVDLSRSLSQTWTAKQMVELGYQWEGQES